MARKPLTQPRKHATQDRSRATVDALVEATARILVTEGYDKASTNRIAEQAGVSVGSLYQYFPGKEALVAAVIDRHNEDLMRMVRKTFADVATLPIHDAVQRLVKVAIKAHRIDPALHRVLAEQIPRTGRLGEVEALNREAHALFKAYLDSRAEELDCADTGLAAYLCVSAVETWSHNAVLYHGAALTRELEDTLAREATRLLSAYLKTPA